ncbi:cardiolipin synthase [Lentisphaerota bacterium WC36G]|nr:cardiolipin synthase [Lentisphaerae bacterium WC36]
MSTNFLYAMINILIEPWSSITFAVVALIEMTLCIHILLTKRSNSVSTTLWLVVVIVIPIIGIVLYLFFGFNRFYTLGRAVSRSRLDFLQEKYASAEGLKKYQGIINKFQVNDCARKGSINFQLDSLLENCEILSNNTLKLLSDGSRAYPEMEKEIMKAHYSIHLSSYILMDDEVGKKLFALLEEKSQQGVKVRIIYDRLGSFYSFWGLLRYKFRNRNNDNFKMYAFSKFNIFTPWRVQMRNHRKLLIVDGKVAFTGGLNISADNMRLEKVPKIRYIHDLHCKIKGSAVSKFQYIFLRDWSFSGNEGGVNFLTKENFPTPRLIKDNGHVRVVESGAGQREGGSAKFFFSAVASAKKSLTIMTPYFTPEVSFIRMLELAVARGVEVKIILPAHNDHIFMRYASSYLYENLLKQNVRIFEKQGIFSHVKAMVVDNKTVMMGSSNCDVRSFILNYELDFVVENSSFVQDVIKQLQHELDNSEEITLEHLQDKKLSQILLENISHLFTPIL